MVGPLVRIALAFVLPAVAAAMLFAKELPVSVAMFDEGRRQAPSGLRRRQRQTTPEAADPVESEPAKEFPTPQVPAEPFNRPGHVQQHRFIEGRVARPCPREV